MTNRGRALPTPARSAAVGLLLLLGLAAWLAYAGAQQTRTAPPRTGDPLGYAPASKTPPIRIDLDHILEGRVNSQGQLVGVHHAPSAPKTMRVDGQDCRVRIEWTSPGTDNDIRTARVVLLDPRDGRVVREKSSTLYPSAWPASRIEAAIREAYADAVAQDRVDRNGRWEGRTRQGERIGGYLSYDGRFIATAFPYYSPPRGGRSGSTGGSNTTQSSRGGRTGSSAPRSNASNRYDAWNRGGRHATGRTTPSDGGPR
jgi:hypothetical protein